MAWTSFSSQNRIQPVLVEKKPISSRRSCIMGSGHAGVFTVFRASCRGYTMAGWKLKKPRGMRVERQKSVRKQAWREGDVAVREAAVPNASGCGGTAVRVEY